MAISSNSLFHFTSDLKILKSILKSGFKVSYCSEGEMAFPMISFCDLPLSNFPNQIDSYGRFAIGMKKEWGIKNGLNPIFYVSENSYLSDQHKSALYNIAYYRMKTEVKYNQVSGFVDFALNFDRLKKPYQGDLTRQNLTVENYKYYDEREWRYIPDIKNKNLEPALTKEEYEVFKKKNPKKPHFKNISLTFKASDIKYLIVSNENDIPKLMNHLMNISNLGSSKQIRLLFTRILTFNQIEEDL